MKYYLHIFICIFLFAHSSLQAAILTTGLKYPTSHHTAINPIALQTALNKVQKALQTGKITHANTLTLVDFSQPSSQKRLWVIDLNSGKILLNTFTTHGRMSGKLYANHFSNQPSSLQSSLGLYKMLNTYYGKHGLSMKLLGLEPLINDNAFARHIVIHGAEYATARFIKMYHSAGRSFGCFAVPPFILQKLINYTASGGLLYAYSNKVNTNKMRII